MKTAKKTPVFIFNEHNEAFSHWQRARILGDLPDALDLFHIDAHHDMGKPSRFGSSLYFRGRTREDEIAYYRKFAQTELSIADFILPAVLNGVVRNVYFVFPKWRKFNAFRKFVTITSAFGEGKVLKYSVKPNALSNPMVAKAYPDVKKFQYAAMKAEQLPKNRKVILDIDMDYFACRDSIHNHMAFDLEITREQFENRDGFLAHQSLPFSGFQFDFYQRDGKYYVNISRKKGKDVSHLPSEEEILNEINGLVSVLISKKIKPMAVTICRSCHSGYCPGDYARFIEKHLLKALQPLIDQDASPRPFSSTS